MCVYYYSTYCKTVRVTFYKEYAAKLWECLEDSVTALQTMSVNSRAGPNVCVCLLLQDLVQSCLRVCGGILEDMCYERRRAEACVD